MAAAISRGWAGAEAGPASLIFTDAGSGRAQELASEFGGEARDTLEELARDSDLVLLAVTPGALERVAKPLGEARAILSILGATPLERLTSAFPGKPVMRALPNIAVEVRRAVIGYAPPVEMDEGMRDEIVGLLEQLGLAVEVEERLMDVVTAISGCSPAYVALVVEALADAGVREGLDARLAHDLVVETFAGTAALLREHDTLAVRRAVASPGGSTAAGLAAFERGAERAVIADAVRASLERMRS
jgi:pyrroline-5-carboxylate reductase